MPRIPEAELDRLKAEVSVARLAEAKGVELKPRGKELVGKCPFHEDDTPSLSISTEKNVWRCFGCGASGSVVDWVMKAEAVSLPHALEILRAGLPGLAEGRIQRRGPTKGLVPKRSSVRKLPGLVTADTEDQDLLRRVVDYYAETLEKSPEAQAYLEGRGLLDKAMLGRFRVGYADRSLCYRVPQRNRKEGAAIRERLIRLGVLRESGHEHLAGSIVVPILDVSGNVVQLYGRKTHDHLRSGTAYHLYLPGPQRGVWNLDGIQGQREVILCEALLDAMTFWSAGYRNVTASYGTNGMTEDHWLALRTSGTERVLLAFDADEAGDLAAGMLSEKLAAMGLATSRVRFPKGMDANEYATKVQPAGKSLGLVLQSATAMAEGTARRSGETNVEPIQAAAAGTLPVEAGSADEAESGAAEEGKGEEKREVPDVPRAAPRSGARARPRAGALPPSASPTQPGPTPPAAPVSPVPPVLPAPVPDLPSSSAAARPEASAVAEVEAVETRATEQPQEQDGRIPDPAPLLVRQGEDLWMRSGDRSYRVQGLEENRSTRSLKVVVRAARERGGSHTDNFDMSVARLRQVFARQAAEEMGVEEIVAKRDIARLLDALEEARDASLREKTTPTREDRALSDADREAALALLRAPDLLDQVLADFTRVGVVGETTNKLVGYLAAVSRKLPHPLAVVIQSSSAAGKSSLMDAVLSFMPEEERVQYSAMTGQSLFYMSETDLRWKILAIAEEEGAERASYALKLLQSEGVLVIASTGKDPTTGRLVTHEYRVEGPVMIFLTTTAIEMDEELLNRCLVLTVDEGREQTRAIHKIQRQRQTLQGVLEDEERSRIVKRHQDAQRLLRPLRVVNPYAEELTFLDHQTRCRRDHMKYLSLIQAIALLHQYQREVRTAKTASGVEVAYIEATREDIDLANQLAHQVLGHSLDELPPQTRRLLGEIVALVERECREQGIPREAYRFTRRQLRMRTGFGDTQLKVHLARLVELEYLVAHPTGRGQGLVYELVYAGEPGSDTLFLPGLLDLDGTGSYAYDGKVVGGKPASVGGRSAPGRASVGGWSGWKK